MAVHDHLLTGNKFVFHLDIVQHLCLKHNIADELLTVGHMCFPGIVQKLCKNFIYSLLRRKLNKGSGVRKSSGKKAGFFQILWMQVSYVWSIFFHVHFSIMFVFLYFCLSSCSLSVKLIQIFLKDNLVLLCGSIHSKINSTVLSVYCNKIIKHSNNAITTENISVLIHDKDGQRPNVLICKVSVFPPESASMSWLWE